MQALSLVHLRAGCGVLGPQRLTKFKHLAVACRSPLIRRPAVRRRQASQYRPAVASASVAATAAGGLPQTYGYLMASVAFTAAVVQWMVFQVSKARKAAGVQYPKLYAEGTNAVSVKFNCIQRVHQNTMENLPSFLIMQILLAQAYPLLASALGVAWAVGRIIYSLGYSSGDANKRLPGAIISNFVQLGTLGTLAFTAFKVLTGRPI
ncbi:hypothetical protein WJX77_012656 [Trebouxia sp. C0004]